MADHTPQHGRRPHFHRGRRGPDRRGNERRSPQREQASEQGPREAARESTGGVDVEQIMQEIRSRIAQRHGIELSTQQVHELAARRLEAILEPRNVKPQLLEQLRRSAGAAPEPPSSPPIETYRFEDTTLYETHRGILRFFRKLLNPILKLFFNPTPLVTALHTQARINEELAARELERERRQSEWNALQYELVQRAVLETSRISIEMQALSSRIESLSAKVDFNDRRVRSFENVQSPAPSRQAPRQQAPTVIAPAASPAVEPAAAESAAVAEGTGEGTRRRRRRRRGRRSGGAMAEGAALSGTAGAIDDDVEGGEGIEGDEDDSQPSELESVEARDASTPAVEPPSQPQPAPQPWSAPHPDAATLPTEHSLSPEHPAEPPVVPTPPRDEPVPEQPVDHADPGPVDR